MDLFYSGTLTEIYHQFSVICRLYHRFLSLHRFSKLSLWGKFICFLSPCNKLVIVGGPNLFLKGLILQGWWFWCSIFYGNLRLLAWVVSGCILFLNLGVWYAMSVLNDVFFAFNAVFLLDVVEQWTLCVWIRAENCVFPFGMQADCNLCYCWPQICSSFLTL